MRTNICIKKATDGNHGQVYPMVIPAHANLVIKVDRWMKNTIGCGVTFREFVAYTSTGEIPDVIGWVNGYCIMAEVKISRTDFLSDKNKTHRQPILSSNVLGHWRFYITLPGVARPDEIPDGWGLYELHGNRIMHIAGAKYKNCGQPPFQSNRRDEVAIMYSALRRLALRGVLDRVYERI